MKNHSPRISELGAFRSRAIARAGEDTTKAVLLLLALAAQLLFIGLGARPIEKIQEARVAETARTMVETGEWIVPYFRGEIRLRKPPLAYWLTALSYKAFGSFDTFAARFASAVFSGATLLVLFFWASTALGPESALRIALCFVSSYIALRYLRSGASDAILLAFVVTACLLVYQILSQGPNLTRVLLWHLAMGVGFMIKGPAAIAIPVLSLVICAIKARHCAILRRCLHPGGIALLLLTAFGWYAIIFYRMPDQAWFWISREVDASFITGRDPNPVYWYLQHFLEFFFPWSLFAMPAAVWLYRMRPNSLPVQFALVWFGVTLALLSANTGKQMQYALLLTPPSMVLLGHYLAAGRDKYAYANRLLFVLLFIAAAVALPALVIRTEGLTSAAAHSLLLLAAGSFLPLALAMLLRFNMAVPVGELIVAGAVGSGWLYGQIHLYAQ